MDFVPEKEKVVKETNGINKESISWIMYNKDIDQNLFRGSFESWKSHNSQYLDIAIYETENDVDYETAVRAVVENEEEVKKILRKEAKKQERVEPKDVYLEAALMGVNAKEYARKINEEVDRQEQEVDISEIQTILREAATAGMNTADEKIREKILENNLQQKIDTSAELSETEKAKKKIAEAKEEENLRNSYLVGERILAGGVKKK